ncbi:MAG: PAS domain S-box protein [Balneolaceae bacterium]|nr:PAS domain S-box protein [Balneolaceae bacterium]
MASTDHSDRQLERIARSVPGILWEADAGTLTFTYVSDQSKTILGYDPKAWYDDPEFWQNHIHPEDRERAVTYCHQKSREGEDHEFEYRMISANGDVVWLKDMVTVEFEDGEPRYLHGLMTDITKQKRLEHEKAKLQRDAYELAQIGHWQYDPARQQLFWSGEVKRIFEVDPEYEPSLDDVTAFIAEKADRAAFRQAMERALREKYLFNLELQLVTGSGRKRWIRITAESEFENGECRRIYGSTQNIDERKRTEDRLRETEQKLRDIIEHSTNLFYRHDTDHEFTYISPQAHRFLGTTPDKAMNSWLDYLTDHPLNKKALEHTNRAIETGKAQPPYEIQLRREDGQTVWAQVNEAPVVSEGKTVAVVGSLTDITKRKRVQEKQEMLSMVASKTENVVIITDPEERIEWVNDAFVEKTGYTLDEALGRQPGELLQGPETEPETKARMRRKVDEGRSFREEALNYTKSGEKYYIKIDVTPIKDENGTIKRFFSIQQDITERKKAEQVLRKQKERLEESQQIGRIGDWDYDFRTGKVTWSPVVYEIYDRDPEKGPPSFEEIKLACHPEDRERFVWSVTEAVAGNKRYSQDYRLLTKDGVPKYIRAIGIPKTDEKGNVVKLHGVVQDITGRKRAEIDLMKREQQLKNITNNIDGMVHRYRLKPDGTDEIVYVSDGVRELHELEPDQVLASPRLLWEQIFPEDVEKVKQSVQKSAENLTLWDHKWRIRPPSGRMKWIHGRGMPQKDSNGSITWDALMLDVTEQEEAKREREELYRVIENSVNEIFIFDTDSLEFLYVNGKAAEDLGYPRQALLGKTPLDVTVEYTLKSFREILQELEQEEKEILTFETKHLRADGSLYPIEVHLKKDIYRGKQVYIAVILDITDQRRADDRLRSLLETAPIPIYIVSKDGRVMDLWNRAAERVIGFSKEEVMGQFLPHVPPGEMEEYRELLGRILSGENVKGEEIQRIKKDGTRFPARLSAGPLINDEGEIDSILVTLEDVTEEKQLEIDLRSQIAFSDHILDSLPGLFYMMDQDMNMVRVNKNVYNFFGFEPEDLDEVDPLSLIAEREQEAVKAKIREVYETGYAETETVMVAGGEEYHYYINGKLIEMNGRMYILGNGIDITDRVRTQRNNAVLLQEVHHRVKNNLAIISGLLYLEINESDGRDRSNLPLQRSINRINSMAKVHELLYNSSDFSSIRIQHYLKELTRVIRHTFDNIENVEFTFDVEDTVMNVNEAIPLGMLLNELITNSLKYAFNGDNGNIQVSISKCNGRFKVHYSDNGKGFEQMPELEEAETLGFTIIHTLLQQLDADYRIDTDAKFEMKFEFSQRKRGAHSNLDKEVM